MANCWYKTKLDPSGLINQNFTLPDLQPMDDGTYNVKSYGPTEVNNVLSQKITSALSALNLIPFTAGLSHTKAGAPNPNEMLVVFDTAELAPGFIRNWSFYISLTDTPFTLNWYQLDNNENPTVLSNIQTGRGGAKIKTWPTSRGTIIDSCTVTNKEILIINNTFPMKAEAAFTSDAWVLEFATYGQEKTFADQVEVLDVYKLIEQR